MAINLNRKGVGLSGENLDKENKNLDLIEEEFKRVGNAVPVANEAKAVATEAKTTAQYAEVVAKGAESKINGVKSEFNAIVAEAGSNNPEVVQARGGEVNLNARLDKTASQIEGIVDDDTFVNYGFKSPDGYAALTAKNQIPVRFALIPSEEVTTGVGGVMKIFADDFNSDKLNYRDCGWYFSADQNADNGYWGNGVFYLNSKTGLGSRYDGKNPDIAFSFQDNVVLARFVYLNSGSGVFYIGNETGQNSIPISKEYNSMGVELGKSMAIKGGKRIYWFDTSTSPVTQVGSAWADLSTGMNIQADKNDLILNAVDSTKRINFKVAGSTIMSVVTNLVSFGQKLIANAGAEVASFLTVKGMLQISNTNTLTSGTTVDSAGKSRIIFSYSSDATISNFTNGSDGQIMYCIFDAFAAGKISIPHGTNFMLKEKVTFVSSPGDTLVFMKTGTKWYQL